MAGTEGQRAMRTAANRSMWIGLLIVSAACFVGLFLRLGAIGAIDLDEALYVAAAREMRLNGEWITPSINGVLFLDKPPLLYWLSRASTAVLGNVIWAYRVPAALSAAALALVIWLLGSRGLGRRAGVLGGAACAISPLVVGAGRQFITDSPLAFTIALAVGAIYGAASAPRLARRWAMVFWIACALGVLTKGAPGLVIPLLVAVVFHSANAGWQVRPAARALRTLFTVPGLLAFVLIAAPWHIAVWRANGSVFVQEYVMRHHLARFQGKAFGHATPIWYYVPVFLVGFFPWSAFVLRPLVRPVRAMESGPSGSSLLLLARVWFWVVFAVFTASSSRLPGYILPALPAAALLLGDALARSSRPDSPRRHLILCAAVAFGLCGLLWWVVTVPGPVVALIKAYSDRPFSIDAVPADLRLLAGRILGAASLGAGLSIVLALLRRRLLSVVALGCGMALFVAILATSGSDLIETRFFGDLRLAARAAGNAAKGGPIIVCVGPPRRPSVLLELPDRYFVAGSNRLLSEEAAPNIAATLCSDGAVILTETKREPEFGITGPTELLHRRGGWSVLRIARRTEKRSGPTP